MPIRVYHGMKFLFRHGMFFSGAAKNHAGMIFGPRASKNQAGMIFGFLGGQNRRSLFLFRAPGVPGSWDVFFSQAGLARVEA